MQTERLSVNNPADMQRAAELLQAGDLVAIPTETVYGLAADATNPDAVRKIFEAKSRPTDHPLITHIYSTDVINQWAKNIPTWAIDLAERFWPGPLTLIMEKQSGVSDIITGAKPSIGLRIPNQPFLLQLLREHSLAIAAPSANPYQRLSPTSADQVLAGLDGKIAAVLDGGPCLVGTESTILSVLNGQATILRAGAITATDLQPFVPVPIEVPRQHTEAVSGNKDIHYQPITRVLIHSAETIESADSSRQRIGLIHHSPELHTSDFTAVKQLANDVRQYRHDLYATLFAMDQQQLEEIWVEQPPESEPWADIRDRLQKAAG